MSPTVVYESSRTALSQSIQLSNTYGRLKVQKRTNTHTQRGLMLEEYYHLRRYRQVLKAIYASTKKITNFYVLDEA
jgi:hypothetical protein